MDARYRHDLASLLDRLARRLRGLEIGEPDPVELAELSWAMTLARRGLSDARRDVNRRQWACRWRR